MEILEVNIPVGISADLDVFENLKRNKLARAQDQTREELSLIKERLQRAFDDYELGEKMFSQPPVGSSIEFLADMAELQSIVNDTIKKNKYQQKMTIFIVGFQQTCSQRLQLLNQISEFFETYGAPEEVNDVAEDSLQGLDVVQINENIQTALDTMDSAFVKLNDLNHGIVDCMNTMHSALSSKSMKNRKKMERNLELAKEDLLKVTDKLQAAQQEIKTKEDQNKKLSRLMENKSKDIASLKQQLDNLKKDLESARKEANHGRFMFEDELRKLRGQIAVQERQLQEFQNQKSVSLHAQIEDILNASLEELVRLKDSVTDDEQDQINFRKEISLQYRVQSRQIQYLQSEELEQVLFNYRKRLSQALEIEVTEDDVQQWGMEEQEEKSQGAEEADSLPPMTPGTGLDDGFVTPASGQISESPTSLPRQISTDIAPLPQPIDLTDYEFWDNLSERELSVHFPKYRMEALHQIEELRDASLQAADDEMIQRLSEDKKKWKSEKSTLLGHIQQLQKLQEEAELDANEAMKQLEEVTAQLDEVQGSIDTAGKQLIPNDAAGQESDNEASREQGTSPDMPPSLAKKSFVEEKRAAILKRREHASSLHAAKTTDSGDMEQFSQSYKKVLHFHEHIMDLLSNHSSSRQTLAQSQQINVDEADGMMLHLQTTLTDVESAVQSLVQNLQDSNSANQRVAYESEDYPGKVAELHSEMQAMRLEYERRSQRDSELIQQLQHSLANLKQDNIPNNMKITRNTPSVSAAVHADQLSFDPGSRTVTREPDVTMMFTRLDSEHNAKTLMNSAKTGRINQETLDSLVVTMEGYNEIANTRFHQLVSKIVHHTKMKEIEVNVRNSNLVTSEVFQILEKMEDLQRRRAQHWSRRMDELSVKRHRLGLLLQDAMQRLEKITGVFLIKPMLSYPGRVKSRKYSGKISTKFNKYQIEAMAAKELNGQAERDRVKGRIRSPRYEPTLSRGAPWTAQSVQLATQQRDRDGLTVSGLTRVDPPAMWNLGASVPQAVPEHKSERPSNTALFLSAMPRLVELDVGRFLHEINPVHTLTSSQKNSPRAIPGPSRSYTGVPRSMGKIPTANVKSAGEKRSHSSKTVVINSEKSDSPAEDYQSTAPPTTPASQSQLRRASTEYGTATPTSNHGSLPTPNLPRPLPPIQVPSRSRASTRSSFTGSPVKDYGSPSPVKSPLVGEGEPIPRNKPHMIGIDVDGTSSLPLLTTEIAD